jgi:two-component sensor histidine kinase
MEMLRTLLAPYLDRISLSGPEVFLEGDPTLGLSMALHELATNACKFGSLSAREGRIALSWKVDRTERGLTLELEWVERHGPAPKRTRRPGFGSKLISMVIERQLSGEVAQVFAPEGLLVRLSIPLAHERWPAKAGSAPADGLIGNMTTD